MRRAWLAAVLGIALCGGARAQHVTCLGQVLPASDGTGADGLPWQPLAGGSGCVALPPTRADQGVIGTPYPGWFFGLCYMYCYDSSLCSSPRPVLIEREGPSAQGPRFLAGYVALTAATSCSRPLQFPTCQLRRIPQPVVSWDPATLIESASWQPMGEDVPGLIAGYRVYVSEDGLTNWTFVGQTAGTSMPSLPVTSCAWRVALKLEILGGVETTVMGEESAPVSADSDGDGYPDACDDCPTVADPMQQFGLTDPIPDACNPRLEPIRLFLARAGTGATARIEVSGALPVTAGLVEGPLTHPFTFAHHPVAASTCGMSVTTSPFAIPAPLTDPGDLYFLAGLHYGSDYAWGFTPSPWGQPYPDASPPCP